MIEITQYSSEMSHLWDNHVRNSRNGTFLHERGFMDYHSNRFADCSLLAVDQSRRLVAVLPANREGDVLCSHRGLSYGGWLMSSRHCDAAVMLEVMHATRQWMAEHRISTLIYKPVPHIYHRYPADDDVYALWRCGAQLTECSISSTIDLSCPLAPDRGNKSGMSRALRAGVSVGASSDWAAYWQVLATVLQERHGTSPVHTLDEIMLLHSRFPDNIKLYTATAHDRVVAGVVMFFTPTTAHAQYIASNDDGRELHALALLFSHLRQEAAARRCRYLDFGISTESHGTVLNTGLLQQKSRLGGRGTLTQVFEWNITH